LRDWLQFFSARGVTPLLALGAKSSDGRPHFACFIDATPEEMTDLLEEAIRMVKAGRYRYRVGGIGIIDGPGLGPLEST
jgi:hypothetical protein